MTTPAQFKETEDRFRRSLRLQQRHRDAVVAALAQAARVHVKETPTDLIVTIETRKSIMVKRA